MSTQPFGRFLLAQKDAPGPLGELAQSAARDPKFPRDGTPEQVSAQLHRHEAPTEFHEALEEAETTWRNLN